MVVIVSTLGRQRFYLEKNRAGDQNYLLISINSDLVEGRGVRKKEGKKWEHVEKERASGSGYLKRINLNLGTRVGNLFLKEKSGKTNTSGMIALDAILTASSAVRSQAIKEPGWKMADVKKINHTGTALDVRM